MDRDRLPGRSETRPGFLRARRGFRRWPNQGNREAMEAFYEFLKTEKLIMLSRRTAAVEDGYLYDEVATDKGTLWVKYRIPS
jgi:hypothetical protein